MFKFRNYCTKEQVEKALRFDAPIVKAEHLQDLFNRKYCFIDGIQPAIITPTSEEMIGWLEEMGVLVDINPINGLHFNWILRTKELDEGSNQLMWESQYTTPKREYNSRKEATLAAIDAALEYLDNKRIDTKS